MRSYTTLKGLTMFIFALVFTVVLSYTLAHLWLNVRQARKQVDHLWKAYSSARIRHDREMSIYNDDTLTIEEKYTKIYKR